MPWSKEPTVVHRRGHDYWRTWFLDECEQAKLFGINQKHLGLVSLSGKGVVPYHAGTQIYFEDAPWFPHTGELAHRVCGPYEVQPTNPLPSGAIAVYAVHGTVIVYKEAHPDRGPWFDRRCRRKVDGQDLRYQQIAGEYHYFPLRFSIVPAADWRAELVPHPASGHCWLCV